MVNNTSAPYDLYGVGRFSWERIIRRTHMKPVALKALALTLATYADAESGTQVHPGLMRLTDDLGQNERTIRRNLETLEEFGLIKKVTQGSRFGRRAGMASEYRLTVPEDVWYAHEADPDDMLLFALDIQEGRRQGCTTWIEANPLKKKQRQPSPTPTVRLNGSPDILDRSPDIWNRTPDIPDRTPGGDVHPSIIYTNQEPSNQEPSSSAPSLRSGAVASDDATPSHEEEAGLSLRTVADPQTIEQTKNQQLAALRAAFPDEEF